MPGLMIVRDLFIEIYISKIAGEFKRMRTKRKSISRILTTIDVHCNFPVVPKRYCIHNISISKYINHWILPI